MNIDELPSFIESPSFEDGINMGKCTWISNKGLKTVEYSWRCTIHNFSYNAGTTGTLDDAVTGVVVIAVAHGEKPKLHWWQINRAVWSGLCEEKYGEITQEMVDKYHCDFPSPHVQEKE